MRQGRIQRYLRRGMLPQLRVLEAVARHGSFTRAAEELHIAQPTASLQIKKLTETVGLPLLEHAGRRIIPTAAGRALGATCEEILRALSRLEDTLSNLRELRTGTLRIAASTSEEHIVPRLLAEFVRRYPGVEVSMRVLPCAEMFARLAEDADDLYICTYPPESGDIAIEPILPNPIVVYARSDHPLVGVMGISFSRFAEEPLLVREPGSGTRAVAERLFAERRLAPRVRMELSSNEAIKEAILSGLGVAILTRYALGVEVSRDELAILDIEGFPLERYWHLAYPTGKRLAPPAQAFVEMVKAEAKYLLAAKRVPLAPARLAHRARVAKTP